MKTHKFQKTAALLLALALIFLTACGSSGGNTQAAGSAASEPAAASDNAASDNAGASGNEADNQTAPDSTGDRKVFTFPITTTVSTLDQTISAIDVDMTASRQFTAGLYKDDENQGFVLDLAESEEISEDGLTRTYKIRDDALWSDGTPITAHDFVYAWQRLADPSTGAEYAFFLETINVKNGPEVVSGEKPVTELGVSASDEKTFVVETTAYVPFFEEIVNFVQFRPLREDLVTAAGDQFGLTADSVLSSGPWVVTEWSPGSEVVVFERNPYYHDQSVTNLDELRIQTISDTQTGVMSYENGDIQYLGLSGDLIDQYKDSAEYVATPQKQLFYLEPNLSNEYLSNVNIRKAIAYAIDRQTIADDILKNGSKPAQFVVVEEIGLNDQNQTFREVVNKDYYVYDESEAQSYWQKGLSELGVDGFEIELLYDDTANQSEVAQFLQATLQSVLPGLTVTTQQQPKKNRLQLMTDGDYDLGLTKWGADYNDPSTFTDLFRTSHSYNHSGYDNPEYEAIVDKAVGEDLRDTDARFQDYDQAEQILMEDLPVIPVYQDALASLIKSNYHVPRGAVTGLYDYGYTTISE